MAHKRLLQSEGLEKQTWLVNNGKIIVFLLAFVLIGGVTKLYFSQAATNITVRGLIADTRTNKPISGIKVYVCYQNKTVTTNTSGVYTFVIPTGSYYCGRITGGVPSGYSGPKTNNRPQYASITHYENQVPGKNCYGDSTCPTITRTWDLEKDDGLTYPTKGPNFTFTSPAPPTVSKFSLSPSSIYTGQSTTLTWMSNGANCTIKGGTTNKTVAGSGSLKVKPTATTTYRLYCSNGASNSSTYSRTVTVNKPIAKPTISSFTASPSSIKYGQLSVLSWSSNGTSCKLKGGITNRVVGGKGTHKVYPGYTTTYSIYCSNSGGNSATKYAKVFVSGSGSNTTPKPTVKSNDHQAPSQPKGFTAAMNTESQAVNLNWQASTDNVGVHGYKLERSENKKQWDLIDPDVTTTSFQDSAVSFEIHYFYRLAAVDNSGNISSYATADVITSSFQPNVKADSDNTVTSEDNVATVLIPKGAVSGTAFCDVTASTDTAAPIINNYKIITGPYSLNCRDEDGAQITAFIQPLGLSIQLNKQLLKGVGTVQIYGQTEDQSWQLMTLTSQDNQKLTYSTDLGDYQTFVVMGQKKKGSILFTVIKILIVLAIIVFLIRFVLRLLAKRRAEGQYEEYLHKSKGL